MPRPAADSVKVEWLGTGSGTMSLGSPVAGFQGFPSTLNGQVVSYSIEHETLAERENGIGIYSSSGNQLTRDFITFSTNSGNRVAFFSGLKFVRIAPLTVDIVENRSPTDPGQNDDIDLGYIAGRSRWLNTTTGSIFYCTDHTANDAQWANITTTGEGPEVRFLLPDQDQSIDVSDPTNHAVFRAGAEWTAERTITFTGTPPPRAQIIISNNSGQDLLLTNGAGSPLDLPLMPTRLHVGQTIQLNTVSATLKLVKTVRAWETTSTRIVPFGGDEGDVLTKVSGDDFHFDWLPPTAAGGGDNVATGTVTARSGAIDFSGGNDGDVLAVQSDGSLALETPSAATVNVDQNAIVMRIISATGPASGLTANDLTEETTPATGDFLLGWESGGNIRKFDIGDLPGGGGGLAPTDIASGTITPIADDLNLSGGTDGQVLTIQADGSAAWEAPSAATVAVDQYDIVMRITAGSGSAGGLTSADLTEELTPAAGDFLLGWESGGAIRKFDIGDLPGGGSGLDPTDIASGTITPRADDVNFSGGATGDVWTVQADGSAAFATPSAATVTVDQYDIVLRTAVGSGSASGLTSADLTEETAPAAGDFLLGWESGGAIRKFDVGDLPSSASGDAAPTVSIVSGTTHTLTNAQRAHLNVLVVVDNSNQACAITIPDASTAGSAWTILARTTGKVTLQRQTNGTVNGGTSVALIAGPGAAASVLVESNAATTPIIRVEGDTTEARSVAGLSFNGSATWASAQTYLAAPVVPDGSFTIDKTSGLQAALDAKAPLASPSFTGGVVFNGQAVFVAGARGEEETVTGTYTVQTADLGKIKSYTGAGHTWTINTVSGVGEVAVENDGTGAITLSAGTATLVGATSVLVGKSATLRFFNAGAKCKALVEA